MKGSTLADGLDKLEQTVEREMALLRALPPTQPSAPFLERVSVAMIAEARRGEQRRHWRRWTRGGLTAAAAVLMAVGLATRPSQKTVPVVGGERELAAWAAAVDESGAHWARLVEAGWPPEESSPAADVELDEVFRSLEQSCERFESL